MPLSEALTSPAVCLYSTIEQGLDNGTIVILPIYQSDSEIGSPTRWKCVLANEAAKNDMIIGIEKFTAPMKEEFPSKKFLRWGVSKYRMLQEIKSLLMYYRTSMAGN